jgi:hypothetical protein
MPHLGARAAEPAAVGRQPANLGATVHASNATASDWPVEPDRLRLAVCGALAGLIGAGAVLAFAVNDSKKTIGSSGLLLTCPHANQSLSASGPFTS